MAEPQQREVTEEPQRGRSAEEHENFYQQLAVENQAGATEKQPGETLTFDSKSFDKIGPKAKGILDNAGVTEIAITPNGNGTDKIEAKLKAPFEIAQDPTVDGVKKLTVGKDFSADFHKGPNGELVLENIKGLKADTEKFGTANVVKITLSRDANGDTEIESVGKKGIFSRTRTRTGPAEVMDKAEAILNRLEDMKKDGKNKMGALNLPSLILNA